MSPCFRRHFCAFAKSILLTSLARELGPGSHGIKRGLGKTALTEETRLIGWLSETHYLTSEWVAHGFRFAEKESTPELWGPLRPTSEIVECDTKLRPSSRDLRLERCSSSAAVDMVALLWNLWSLTERLYKPPMNPYVVSSCLRASLGFPCATHGLAYAADSKQVKLTHRLRVGVVSVSPQELLTRAPFLVQPPELFKMMWMTLRKKMTKNYPHEFQWLGVAVLTASQETGSATVASIARASGQPS